jgi:hypothetical protein
MSTIDRLAEVLWNAAQGDALTPLLWADATEASRGKYRRMAEAAAAHLVVALTDENTPAFGDRPPDLA